MSPLDLTIVIPVRNEETNLANCLRAIGPELAANIVVIDSHSTDRTQDIAREFGVEVIVFNWNGHFPKKRNWYLRMHPPQTKWVMFLDADEYLTPKFKSELRNALTQPSDVVGYWLNYTVYFLGKELKGGYPLRKLALFQVGKGEYEMIDEDQWSHLDMEIHEHPILNGKIGLIESKIDHQDFRGISHYVDKHNAYASWEAARFMKLYSETSMMTKFTWKQRIKYRLIKTPLVGPAFFFGSFILLGGFRDGTRGFTFAILKTAYFIQVYCKIREKTFTQTYN
ncbi:glycosyltransferase family 2 protein [Dyadobacter sp. CY326]|uniref:glycosyltransferase family 2 protein n=1 Tax=Dyadobacter sp. CY326 TaxID=2907300 RepID=UPI001F456834|nr:glycosyltransferase family 2 protein [Dyadobacter sp. CY326]MCE7066144.1 glycosyltransferase family 2 protein [Dyadobacter sp. CY326]